MLGRLQRSDRVDGVHFRASDTSIDGADDWEMAYQVLRTVVRTLQKSGKDTLHEHLALVPANHVTDLTSRKGPDLVSGIK